MSPQTSVLKRKKIKMAADIVGIDVLLEQARDLFRTTFGGEAVAAAAAPGR